METQEFELGKQILASKLETLSFEKYGEVAVGKIVKVLSDHMLVEVEGELYAIYDRYNGIDKSSEGKKAEFIQTVAPMIGMPSLVLSENQLEKINDSASQLSGIVIDTEDKMLDFIPGFGRKVRYDAWVYFPTFGKIGYYSRPKTEKLKIGKKYDFIVACTSHLDVHIYQMVE